MLERQNVDQPMWRKKVDSSLLKDAETPIPKWLWEIWRIEVLFGSVNSKNDHTGNVTINFGRQTYLGNVRRKNSKDGLRYRLSFDRALSDLLCDTYLMSYMRALESELTLDKNPRQVEVDISFWEFLDIEFDTESKVFRFTPHYRVTPQFPNLFARLTNSAPLKSVRSEILEKNALAIHKQDWRPRDEFKSEIGATNVIYMLIDTTRKLLYVGEAKDLRKRFSSGHTEIKNWDYYKYNVLPPSLASFRLAIERMIIRDVAALMDNSQSIPNFKITDYRLANKKIDR